jgi:hypothetical protein
MERISKFGAAVSLGIAFCLLRSGIVDHLNSGSAEIVPPNNWFIGLGSLFAGMGVVMIIIAIKTRKRNAEPMVTIS